MKIKVLHIIKSLGRGGAEMLLPETLQLHDKEKFEFHYIYFLPWKDQMVGNIEDAGGRVSCIAANNNIQLMNRVGVVKRYIKENNIQVVHAHLPWAGFLARLIYKQVKIPLVYTEHNKQERYHRITGFLNRLTFGWQNYAIAVSKDVEESILSNIGRKTTVHTILNGVNTEKFRRNTSGGRMIRTQYNIPDSALVVGTVAVFRFQKRLKEWIRVFKKASDHNPNLMGIIVGDGPLRDELHEERRALGLEKKLLMPGLQTNTLNWFSAMDIFMMTSVFEGLPIALLEAMSMECAVLSTEAGGVKEVIENGESGLTVSVNEVELLSEKLKDMEEGTFRSRLAKNARLRVKHSFSLSKMVDELEQVYLVDV